MHLKKCRSQEEIVRDTVITVTIDTVTTYVFLACDSLGNVVMTQKINMQGLINQRALLENNILKLQSWVTAYQVRLQVSDKIYEHYRYLTKFVEVNKITWWQHFWIRTGQILSAVMMLFIGFLILKILAKR